jgi:hypothetical protein
MRQLGVIPEPSAVAYRLGPTRTDLGTRARNGCAPPERRRPACASAPSPT